MRWAGSQQDSQALQMMESMLREWLKWGGRCRRMQSITSTMHGSEVQGMGPVYYHTESLPEENSP